MNNTELKGRLMLKVVGILYIIFAALSILTGLMAVVGGAALGKMCIRDRGWRAPPSAL